MPISPAWMCESCVFELELGERGLGYPRFVEQTLRDYLVCSYAELGPTMIWTVPRALILQEPCDADI